MGNGRLGAMIHGGTARETIQFNEDTLWTGQPHDYANQGAYEVLEDLRDLLRNDRQAEAHALAQERFMSRPLRQLSYQPFGTIQLEFPGHDDVTQYRRSLDIENAVATVSYEVDGTHYRRETIASAPDHALLVHLTAEEGSLDFNISLDSPHQIHQIRIEGDEIILQGMANDYSMAAQQGPVEYPESELTYEARLQVSENDGTLTSDSNQLRIEGATRVTLQLVAATSFVNYNDISADPAERCSAYTSHLKGKDYQEIKQRHIEDYQKYLQRVSLDLGVSEKSYRPTQQRVATFKKDEDPNLVALVFQYGRYLLISSSRPGTQPANLQGIWNDQLLPPWDSKYTMNINVEMNYWPAEVTNLSELSQPLIRMVQDLSETGQQVAEEHYNLPGWVAHHNTDLWRGAAPINHANHGIWPTGGAWLCQHLWWHYQFSGDEEYLRSTAYPALKTASQFFADYLIPSPDNPEWLISGPSNSPETGGLVMGPTMDHQIIRNLFSNTIEASQILGVDQAFAAQLEELRKKIAPNQIGRHGQLQEWLPDVDDPNNTHRHISHLWGLFPGNEIHPLTTPDLAAACQVTLDHRGSAGDGGRMGWSAAWKINFMARLLDGESAFASLKELISPVIQESKRDSSREKLYVNIFDANPPFQIEENFGATSGIAEMLLQSQLRAPDGSYYQDVLPALPDALSSGIVAGLKGRGGFEFTMTWTQGRLISVQVLSLLGSPLNLRYADQILYRETKAGEVLSFLAEDLKKQAPHPVSPCIKSKIPPASSVSHYPL